MPPKLMHEAKCDWCIVTHLSHTAVCCPPLPEGRQDRQISSHLFSFVCDFEGTDLNASQSKWCLVLWVCKDKNGKVCQK